MDVYIRRRKDVCTNVSYEGNNGPSQASDPQKSNNIYGRYNAYNCAVLTWKICCRIAIPNYLIFAPNSNTVHLVWV